MWGLTPAITGGHEQRDEGALLMAVRVDGVVGAPFMAECLHLFLNSLSSIPSWLRLSRTQQGSIY